MFPPLQYKHPRFFGFLMYYLKIYNKQIKEYQFKIYMHDREFLDYG